MGTQKKLALFVVLAAMLVPAIAYAGSAKPGGTYVGETKPGHRVTIKVNGDGTAFFLKTVNPCGERQAGGELSISRKGYFAVSADDGSELRGRFQSKQKVTGTIKTPTCSKGAGRRGFVARLGG